MKKTRKNMLRSSAAMLLVSALALTTATYAWFTNGLTGSVENFTLTAEDASGIELSADAENWYSALPWSEITSLSSNLYPGKTTKISPVSSTGATGNDGKLQFYKVEVNPESNLVTASLLTTEANTNCIKFDLYVKNQNTSDITFNLDLESATATADGSVTETANAVRVAFIDRGFVKIGSTNDIASVKTKNETKIVNIWEPNATSHTNATYSGQQVTTNAINAPIDSSKKGEQVMLSNNIVTDANFIAEQKTTYSTNGLLSLTKDKISANTITKLTVYVWRDGQDVDCTNQAALGKVIFNLKFKAEKQTAASTTTTTTTTTTPGSST
jgi:hypothetical protein